MSQSAHTALPVLFANEDAERFIEEANLSE